MRRIITTIALTFCYIISVAQIPDEHLKFKGVPIDGSLNTFISKMKSAGFSYQGTEGSTAVLQGDFAGFKDCFIGVSTLDNLDVVSGICVLFPERDDWSTLEHDYFLLKDMLTEKYAKPTESVEEFEYHKNPEDNATRFHLLKMDQCKYHTMFEIPNGTIYLYLTHQGYGKCCVGLLYWDKINSNAVRAKAMDDL